MDVPDVIPSVELKGSHADKVKTLDVAIGRLYELRKALAGQPVPGAPPYEFYGRYINAPVWPWFAAGWVVGVLFILSFMIAWSYS